MKISQKQTALLAREIVNQLKAKKAQRISDDIKVQLVDYISKRKVLYDKKNEIQEEINKHEMSLYKITGHIKNLYGSDNLPRIIEKVEEKNIPSVQSIEDEIILKSMFQSEDDMQKFVDAIVNKYTKKLQSKILSN